MTGTGQENAAWRVPAGDARVLVIGEPSPLRSAVAGQLRSHGALLACLDTPARRRSAAPSSQVVGSGCGLTGATVVLVTAPRPPGLASRLRYRVRAPALAAGFGQAAMTARDHGAVRLIVLSTVFLYSGDRGVTLHPGSPTLAAAETASAAAAEEAASLFTRRGGDSVILRLGWAYGSGEGITSRVLATAGRGWQLIDGDQDAWLATIAQPDAVRAILAALTLPPGTYNVTDGFPVTQGMLNAQLAAALARHLHPLDDPRWGRRGVLFGRSRRIADSTFSNLTGWQPHVTRPAENLARLLYADVRSAG